MKIPVLRDWACSVPNQPILDFRELNPDSTRRQEYLAWISRPQSYYTHMRHRKPEPEKQP